MRKGSDGGRSLTLFGETKAGSYSFSGIAGEWASVRRKLSRFVFGYDVFLSYP